MYPNNRVLSKYGRELVGRPDECRKSAAPQTPLVHGELARLSLWTLQLDEQPSGQLGGPQAVS